MKIQPCNQTWGPLSASGVELGTASELTGARDDDDDDTETAGARAAADADDDEAPGVREDEDAGAVSTISLALLARALVGLALGRTDEELALDGEESPGRSLCPPVPLLGVLGEGFFGTVVLTGTGGTSPNAGIAPGAFSGTAGVSALVFPACAT